MEPWQQRVVDEKAQLDEKLQKLVEFLGTDQFENLDLIDRTLLRRQENYMTFYSDVLASRIRRFGK